jgi:hypothetical protein
MKIECTDNKTFQLFDDGLPTGQLTYASFFSFKAAITLLNSDRYEINPVGFFDTSINVLINDQEIASLKMNWKGHIVISFQDGREFVFKATGSFYNNYFIENTQGEKMMQFEPHFKWSKFNYNYDISYDKKPQDLLLVLLGIYAANYFIAFMSGMA